MLSFSFLYMVSYTWPFDSTSIYCLSILLFDLLLTLLSVGGIAHYCILYHNCMGCSTRNSCSGYILLGDWLGRDIFEKSIYYRILSWYHMVHVSFESFQLGLWHGRQIVVSFRVLFSVIPYRFLGADVMLSGSLFFLIYIGVTNNVILLDVVRNEQFLSLHYMDDGSWSWSTVKWRLVFNTRMAWILL